MKSLFSGYKILIIVSTIIIGGYAGIIALKSYQQDQINTAVQAKTSQLEQQIASQAASSNQAVNTIASSTVDERVGELEAEIQKLKLAQAQPSKKISSVGNTTQTTTPQKQVAAPKGTTINAPVITSVNPIIMIADYENTVTVNGSGFVSGTKVKLGDSSLQLSGTVTPTLISVHYPSGFNPGLYDVTVINPNGGQSTFPGAITIRPGSPKTQANNILTTAQIVAKVSPSVVLIHSNLGCGSGMIVQDNGMILTDDHVIRDESTKILASGIEVYFRGGATTTATVVRESYNQDLALLKIDKDGLSTVSFVDSSDTNLPLGSSVVSLGYPETCDSNKTLTVQAGIITARETVRGKYAYLGELLQTSALMNPGASGGPLIDQYGNVVGINELAKTLGTSFNITGISYATQANIAKSFLDGLPASPIPTPIDRDIVPFGIVNQGIGLNHFVITGSGFCSNTAGANVLLTGYPLQRDYPIPQSSIELWTANQINFSVPNSIPEMGNFKVTVRGYHSNTPCDDVRISGTAAVQL